jgi:hypothetical protein
MRTIAAAVAAALTIAFMATWSLDASADSDRKLELVYVTGEVGGAYVNVGDRFTNQASQGGVALGIGAGVRVLFFTIGVRGRFAPLSAYTLMEANVEAGFHVPLGDWDPYLGIHGGYAHAGMNAQQVFQNVSYTPQSPSGGDFGGSLGIDYYLSSTFSLGIDATLDALFLGTSDTYVNVFNIPVLVLAGQSQTGVAFLGTAHAGLHF